MPHFLYILRISKFFHKDQCKIGISNNPDRRLREINQQSDLKFKILYTVKFKTEKEARKQEKRLHGKYKLAWQPPKEFDGDTELRILTKNQINEIKGELHILDIAGLARKAEVYITSFAFVLCIAIIIYIKYF